MVFVNSNQSATINGSDGATRNYKQPQTERSGDKRPVTWWRPLICFSSVSYYFFFRANDAICVSSGGTFWVDLYRSLD